ncbi:hypothetical protein KCG35_19210 [Zooshikella sp. WH53]|uniref:Uncharacterized protein n=2 Tax=Zooshikella harenae TaxID=2827238 RepID=A0ABS5ZGU8_9GAMM|nr:hypothetical protein [Zooshikella harenae]
MIYQGEQKTYPKELKDNLEVSSVSGGEKTNPAWTSEIDNDAFSAAVKKSLSSQGLLSESGKYQLEVKMLKVDQPLFGFDMTVTTHVQYTLTDKTNNVTVLNETIVAPYTATVSDAFSGIKRLRLANEGSGKKNITGLLEKLSKLNISSHQISVSVK